MKVVIPAQLRQALLAALIVFSSAYALIVAFVVPTAGVGNVIGVGVFVLGAIAGSPRRGVSMGLPRALVVLVAAAAIPWLGAVALDPVEGSFTTGAWYVSAVFCLALQLLAQRRTHLAGLATVGLVVQTLVWAGPSGLIRFDVVPMLVAMSLIVAAGRAVAKSADDLERVSSTQRGQAELRVAQNAYVSERETRLMNTQVLAAEMLHRIAAAPLTDAEKAECLVLHQTIRDEIRGRRLLNDAMREQLIAHRRRGAFVQLMDDGGLDDLPAEVVEPMLDRIAAALDGVLSDRIVVRTMPPDSPKAVSVVATTSDPVAAALGLDEDEDQVDLWLELDRPAPVAA